MALMGVGVYRELAAMAGRKMHRVRRHRAGCVCWGGLQNQPRAVVFYEKHGRRHAHAVWSRIDAEEMKAVQLSFSKNKLQEVARELYIEHGWTMPRGFADKSLSDPRNFTLAEWQQAKRTGQDAGAMKAAMQDAWAISDSKEAFAHAMQERGFKVARGDRRGFVAVAKSCAPYDKTCLPLLKYSNIKKRQRKAWTHEQHHQH